MQVKALLKRKEIETILVKINKNLDWLAETAGVDPSYLSKLLSGDRNPSDKVRERLMGALNANWDDIFEIKQDDLDEESQPMAL